MLEQWRPFVADADGSGSGATTYTRPLLRSFALDSPGLSLLQGLVLTPEAEKQFSCEEESPFGFEFVVSDIQEIRPIVRVRKKLNLGSGPGLLLAALAYTTHFGLLFQIVSAAKQKAELRYKQIMAGAQLGGCLSSPCEWRTRP